jgi:hypothetical protein
MRFDLNDFFKRPSSAGGTHAAPLPLTDLSLDDQAVLVVEVHGVVAHRVEQQANELGVGVPHL